MNEEGALQEIAEIEHKLTKFSKDFGFRYDFEVIKFGSILEGNCDKVNIKVYKELN